MLAVQVLMVSVSAWVLSRLATIRCGPEAVPESHTLIEVAVLGSQVAAIALVAVLLGRARTRYGALAALGATLFGCALGAACLVFTALFAMSC